MDLIHPATREDVADALRDCSAQGYRVLPVGGRTHMDRGGPVDADVELWTTQLDELVAYDPAEMLAVTDGGMRIRDLQAALAEGGQEWPVDAPADATVGGVIAAGVSSPRRLRVGHVRDTVTEIELVTGDGRLVRSGARTVKNVTGFDLHRLVTGSLGTLGVVVRAAMKVRPLPKAVTTLRADGDGLGLGGALLDAVPGASMIAADAHGVTIRLEGWRAEVRELRTRAVAAVPSLRAVDDGLPTPRDLGTPIVAEVAVPPSSLRFAVRGAGSWSALVGVGIVWVGARDRDALDALRRRVVDLGGIAPVVLGPGGLGTPPSLPAPQVQRRLKEALDPAGILAPGRAWHEGADGPSVSSTA